jgi:alanyl-tRNA synthetase
MGEVQGQDALTKSGEKDPEEIRREIEDTREELGDTVAALAAKTDVKARAKDKVDSVKHTITEKKESIASSAPGGNGDGGGAAAQASSAVTQVKAKAQENPIVVAAIGALVVGFLLRRITSD